MEATTIRTAVDDLACGDVVLDYNVNRVVLSATTDDRFGTWIMWKDGGRDSYPIGYKVYRVVAA